MKWCRNPLTQYQSPINRFSSRNKIGRGKLSDTKLDWLLRDMCNALDKTIWRHSHQSSEWTLYVQS